jgi:hypothetical protein
MLRFVAFLSLILVGTPIFGAEPPPASGQDQESHRQALLPVEQPLLKKVFRSQFSKEQLAQFKDAPSLEQLVQSMSPEQRQAARGDLARLEAKAKTPDELAQIARGYLMLDEQGPDRGQNVFRVAAQLEQLDPGSPVAPTLAAEAFFKRGDYPSATKAAEEALKRNRDDPAANVIYNLSEGRRGTTNAGAMASLTKSESLGDSQSALPNRHNPERPMKSVYASLGKHAPGGRIDRGIPPIGTITSEVVSNTPLGPLSEEPKNKGKSPLGTIATIALTTSGALLLFGGLGGKALEERFPNIRRDMSIAVVASGVAAAGALSLSALASALPTLPTTQILPQLAWVGVGSSAGSGGAGGALAIERTRELIVMGGKMVSLVSGARLTSDIISYARAQKDPAATQPGNRSNQHPEPERRPLSKPSATNSELQRAIDKLFQPGDRTPGGTAGAVREEFATGKPTQGRFHLQAAKERINWLNRIIREQELTAQDRATAEALRNDLQQAVDLPGPRPSP